MTAIVDHTVKERLAAESHPALYILHFDNSTLFPNQRPSFLICIIVLVKHQNQTVSVLMKCPQEIIKQIIPPPPPSARINV